MIGFSPTSLISLTSFTISLTLVLFIVSTEGSLNSLKFNRNYEPWSNLYNEGELLTEYLEVEGLDEEDQSFLPGGHALLTFKMVVESYNYSKELETIDYKNNSLVVDVVTALTAKVQNSNITTATDVVISYIRKFRSVDIPLVYGYIVLGDERAARNLEIYLQKKIDEHDIGLDIHRGRVSGVKSVDKNSVVELVIQLLGEPWPYSMNDENSDHRMNLTDVFLHLIQPKFKNVFGEHYYRTVISHLDKTTESIIVISHILLDPDQENLYHATKIWYSELGYVTFGRWKLFPSNLEVTRSRVVPIRYYPYLSDRSYLAPQAPEFQNVSPILTITLPSAIVVFCCIIIVVGTLVFMHWFAFEKDSDRYKIFKSQPTDAQTSSKYP